MNFVQPYQIARSPSEQDYARGRCGSELKKESSFILVSNFIAPLGFLPWEIQVAFPGGNQLGQSRNTQPTMQA